MRKILNSLFCLALILALALTSFATEVPDPERIGTVTFRMEWETEPLDSGSLTVCRIGQIVWKNDGYFFELIPELEGARVSLDDLEDTELPGQLSRLVKEYDLQSVTQPVTEGQVCFELQAGLYVVTQSEAEACEGFKPINSFLISLPRWDETSGTYLYDLIADPKVALETEPAAPPVTEPSEPTDPSDPGEPTEPTDPTEPEVPDLPQTGQLNWPIPVMLASGVVLFAIGCVLCFGKKRHHES